MTKREEILRIFPDYMRSKWEKVVYYADKLQEIRLAVGRPVRVMIAGQEKFVSVKGALSQDGLQAWCMTERDVEEIIKNVCHYSVYAYENEIRQGFLTVPGGHRIGIAGQVVLQEEGNIRNIRHIRFLNVRISHEIIGAAKPVLPFLYQEGRFLNTLIISPPGCGKTTMLRDIIRLVSGGNSYASGMQVGIVDERSEIAGSFMGIPQNDVGIRTDVLDACPKVQGMMLLMRSMAPSVVAVDEIGSREDMQAVFQVLQCGGSVAATMHGSSMEDVENKTAAAGGSGLLFERYIFLEKREGSCQVKGIFGKEKEPLLMEGNKTACFG